MNEERLSYMIKDKNLKEVSFNYKIDFVKVETYKVRFR